MASDDSTRCAEKAKAPATLNRGFAEEGQPDVTGASVRAFQDHPDSWIDGRYSAACFSLCATLRRRLPLIAPTPRLYSLAGWLVTIRIERSASHRQLRKAVRPLRAFRRPVMAVTMKVGKPSLSLTTYRERSPYLRANWKSLKRSWERCSMTCSSDFDPRRSRP